MRFKFPSNLQINTEKTTANGLKKIRMVGRSLKFDLGMNIYHLRYENIYAFALAAITNYFLLDR